MKTLTLVLVGLVCFSLIAVAYTYFLISINYGIKSYNEYYGLEGYETKCQFKKLNNGCSQLENCVIYCRNK